MSDDDRANRRGPGRPRRPEEYSRISFELPARLHDVIIKAADERAESIAEWVRDSCTLRLRREGKVIPKPPEDDGSPPPPLVVG